MAILLENSLKAQIDKAIRIELEDLKTDPSKLLRKQLKESNDFENSQNLLLERGGVAAFPYNKAIQNICNYVNSYIRTNEPNADNIWVIKILPKLTKPIDIFKNLNLVVTVKFDTGEFDFGSGESFVYANPKAYIADGKWINEQINITALCDEHRYLYNSTLYNSLYHEINHKYEELRNYLFDGSSRLSDDNNRLRIQAGNRRFTNDNATDELIHDILYHLFSSSELNALIAGAYGDFAGMKSQRQDFMSDRESTQAYLTYYKISHQLPLMEKMPDVDWMNLWCFLYGDESINNVQINQIKNKFYRKVNQCLKKLYKGLTRAAMTYYDYSAQRKQRKIIKPITVIK